jgi:hypothetical protein
MGHAVYYEQYAAPLRALPQPTITHDRSLVDGCYAEDAKVVSHSMRAFDGPGRAVRLADGRVVEIHGARLDLYAIFPSESAWLQYRRPMPESRYWDN